MLKLIKILKRTMVVLLCLAVLIFVLVLCVNAHVKNRGGEYIISPESASSIENADCILVLGCGVKADGTPSDMLYDRIKRGVELYFAGVAPKLLMSGDHGQTDYDEVNVMKQYAIDFGVPSEDVFMDHAGFSTYESIYRAKKIFMADSIVIVTQEYHLYRALYIAEKLDVTAYGVNCDYRTYGGQIYRDIREILARNKDCLTTIFKPEPTFLGEVIPVVGNGNVTND